MQRVAHRHHPFSSAAPQLTHLACTQRAVRRCVPQLRDRELRADCRAHAVELRTFTTVAPKWEPGDTIPLGRRTLRVIGVRNIDTDEPTELIVEDMSK
jgi:hypothetical protein